VNLRSDFTRPLASRDASVSGWDEPVVARGVRFTLTVLTPVVAGLVLGARGWLIYALVSAIVSFAADAGGRPEQRLVCMVTGAACVMVGGALGTLAAGEPVLIGLLFSFAGIIYAITESLDPLALTASRFLCFGIALGALYLPLTPLGAVMLAVACLASWVISCAWDLLRRDWRKWTGPVWATLWHQMRDTRNKRWPFAAAVGIAIPCAYAASLQLGIERPYWAMLTLVLVLRVDFISSRQLMVERLFGTLLGVVVAGGYAAAFSSHEALLVGIVLAALARWPAEQRHGALGVAALTTFVMLVLALASTTPGEVSAFLKARVVDTIVGCVFAVVALYLDRAFGWMGQRWPLR